MLKRRIAIAALAAALLVVGYVWRNARQSVQPMEAIQEQAPVTELATGMAPEAEATPPSEPAAAVAAAPTGNADYAQADNSPPSAFGPISDNSVGMTRNFQSVDFSRYLLLTSISDAVKDNRSSGLQQLYGLSDEEVNAAAEYGARITEADRDFQSRQHKELCARRQEFRTLHSFGVALNEYTESTEKNQERLAREAESALDAAAYAKINSVVLGQRPQEITVADFPAIFAARNSDLATELKRFCDDYLH